MKKVGFILIISLSMVAALFSNTIDEDVCCPPPRPITNCADIETHRIGMSMMGWGLALIAAIAIIAGTVNQSTADSTSSN